MRVIIVTEGTAVEEMGAIEDLILARNQLKIIDEGYQELGFQPPEWIAEKQLQVSQEINLRTKAELLRRLKTARARRSALATMDEKRKNLDTEIAELEKKLI